MPAKTTALLVDDEPLAREAIRQLLQREPGIEILGECADGFEAVQAIGDLKPDLVFLDIQMPEMNGFEVLDAVGPDMPFVVFVTAYDEFAIEAFRFHAADYLLKPINAVRFHDAVQHILKLKNSHRMAEATAGLLSLIAAVTPERIAGHRFIVRLPGRVQVVAAADVEWISMEGDNACLHVAGKKHWIRATMKSLEARLDSHTFVRIHRSTLINIRRLQELRPLTHGDALAVLKDGSELAVSRSYRNALAGALSQK